MNTVITMPRAPRARSNLSVDCARWRIRSRYSSVLPCLLYPNEIYSLAIRFLGMIVRKNWTSAYGFSISTWKYERVKLKRILTSSSVISTASAHTPPPVFTSASTSRMCIPSVRMRPPGTRSCRGRIWAWRLRCREWAAGRPGTQRTYRSRRPPFPWCGRGSGRAHQTGNPAAVPDQGLACLLARVARIDRDRGVPRHRLKLGADEVTRASRLPADTTRIEIEL